MMLLNYFLFEGPRASSSHPLNSRKPHLSNLVVDTLKSRKVQVSRKSGLDAKSRTKIEAPRVSKGQKDGDYAPSQSDSDSPDSVVDTESEEFDSDTGTEGEIFQV